MTQHTATGAGAPTAAPPSLSAHYTDTDTGDLYIASGTASAADWGQPINEPARVITESAVSFTLTAAHRVVHATSPIGDGNLLVTLPLVVTGRWHHEVFLNDNASDRNIDLIQPAGQVLDFMGGDPSLADGLNTGYIGSSTVRLSQPANTRWRLVLDRPGEGYIWTVQALDVTQFQSVS